MKIATWNLERLEKRKNSEIKEILINLDADLLILTETNSAIQLENYTCISAETLPNIFEGIKYKEGENRVSIWTKYKVKNHYKTFDSFTAVCCDVKTPFGILTVYGSIIGVFGNRQPRFNNDLLGHLSDFKELFPGRNVCFAGDLNVTFSGRVWPSKVARQILNDTFKNYDLINTTENIVNNVDHIVLSKDFIKNKKLEIFTWNEDKKLSDHVGHLLTLTEI